MNQQKQVIKSATRQIKNVERACWFARLAFGDWSNTPIPEPAKHESSGYCVLP